MNPFITGMGLITPFGSSTASFWEGLQDKRKAKYERKKILTRQGERELGVYSARIEGIDEYIPARARRRMEPFVQMGVLASHLALKDAGIPVQGDLRAAIVFGSAYGCMNASFSFQDSVIDYGDPYPSPTHFANSVNNTPASQISMAFNIQGPCTTVSCNEMTTALVMQTAWDLLAMDRVDVVLACIGEENGKIRQYATASFSTGKSDRPLAPSEAVACFILEKDPHKPRYGELCDIVLGRDPIENEDVMQTLDAVIPSGKSAKAKKDIRTPFFNYTSKYGCMPSGDAFALAIAGLSLKKGFLPCSTLSLSPNAILGCSHSTGFFNSLLTIRR